MNPALLSRDRRDGRERGFTLVEMMIVVAVIALLAAIALPSYRQSVIKSHRADAKSALLDLAARQERFFSINGVYSNSGTALGYSGAFPVAVTTNGQTYYNLSVTWVNTSPTVYSASAAPTTSQPDTSCGTYQINQLGQQTVSTSATNCW